MKKALIGLSVTLSAATPAIPVYAVENSKSNTEVLDATSLGVNLPTTSSTNPVAPPVNNTPTEDAKTEGRQEEKTKEEKAKEEKTTETPKVELPEEMKAVLPSEEVKETATTIASTLPSSAEVSTHAEKITEKTQKVEEKAIQAAEVVSEITAVQDKKEELAVKHNQVDAQVKSKQKEVEELKATLEAKKVEIKEKKEAEEAAAKAEAEAAQKAQEASVARSGSVNYGAGTANSYAWGQCTWGAKNLAPWAGSYWGNANQWDDSARAEGFATGHVPRVGAIAVWNSGYYGHVAVVTDVDPATGAIRVMESNYAGSQSIGDYRGWFHDSSITYIYPKG